MDEIEKILSRLIHDLRSPLGVAVGYLRLIKADQLAADERERALTNTIEALGRMWRLCEDAEARVATLAKPSVGEPE